MNKLKLTLKVLAYVVSAILAIPAIIILAICAAIIYGVFWLQSEIVCDIWDDELTNEWNKMINAFGDMMDSIKDWFIFEMELV